MSHTAPSHPARTPTAFDLRLYFFVRFVTNTAMQIQAVAVGWQVYDLTHDPLALGYVGLAQFVPMVLLVLPAGDLTDRADRRFVLLGSLVVQTLAAVALLALTLLSFHVIWLFYCAVALFGVARGLSMPATLSFLPFLVTPDRLPRAVAWSSSVAQIATISGPALGGVLYLLGPAVCYGVSVALFLMGAAAITLIHIRKSARAAMTANGYERVKEGIRYMVRKPVLLGAISLDLFAVLFGGAVALLPVYARDILHVGPEGLGILRCAPAIGAALTAIALSRWPLSRRLGTTMFASVALFGLATIVFGISTNFFLSMAALITTGVADQVSVVIRLSLVQLATADHMQGRVNAVNSLFIGASNELGEFESGVTAGWWGAVPAVIVGGLGTLAVVLAWIKLFPALKKIDRFAEVMPVPSETAERL